MFIWSAYLLGLGLVLVLAPNVLLGLFGFPPTQEVWIRVVGVLVLLLCYYCIRAGRGGSVDFMRWSVHGRASVIVFFLAFVLLGWAQPALILFGIVDLAGAALTAWGLRNDAASHR